VTASESGGTGADPDTSEAVVAPLTDPPDDGPDPATDRLDALADALLDQALVERHALVRLCLYALDRARSSGVAERIEAALAEVGVVAVRPEGARFDPALHEAGGTVPTDDPALAGLVAETEVVGFSDRGRPLRAPVVTVYTMRGGAG
jgi:hypothetical protein